jgi:hypothetical protein
MTQEMLCTGTTQNIAALIEQCAFPSDAFLLVERLPQQVVSDEERQDLLRFARLGDGVDVSPYTSGRIFSATFELRWERDAETTNVVYLGEQRTIPGLRQHSETFEPQGKPKRYYLFGQRLDDLAALGIEQGEEGFTYYAQVRIPRLLRYPIAAPIATEARWVQLLVGEYYSQAKGPMFRFQDLQPAKDDGGSA